MNSTFSNILSEVSGPKLAVFATGQRVQWHEEAVGMICTGIVVHALHDCLGFPTNTFLITVDADFRPFCCHTVREKLSGLITRNVRLDKLVVEEQQAADIWWTLD